MEIDVNAALPAGTDIDRILQSRVLMDLAALIHTRDVIEATRLSLDRLDKWAPVTAVHVLRATHLAARQLETTRYRAMRDARVDGASWSAIGTALKMSKQGALDWYNKHSLDAQQDTSPGE